MGDNNNNNNNNKNNPLACRKYTVNVVYTQKWEKNLRHVCKSLNNGKKGKKTHETTGDHTNCGVSYCEVPFVMTSGKFCSNHFLVSTSYTFNVLLRCNHNNNLTAFSYIQSFKSNLGNIGSLSVATNTALALYFLTASSVRLRISCLGGKQRSLVTVLYREYPRHCGDAMNRWMPSTCSQAFFLKKREKTST